MPALTLVSGPDPHMALSLIDRLDLYNTIFTNPKIDQHDMANTDQWNLAYDQLLAIVRVSEEKDGASSSATLLIQRLLLPNSEHLYLAWLLCAFVPWARAIPVASGRPKSKAPPTVAAKVAREGVDVNSVQTKIIDNAVLSLPDILKTREAINERRDSPASSLKRKQDSDLREAQGMAIRRWGVHWRSNVIFALLVDIMETGKAQGMFGMSHHRHVEANSRRTASNSRQLCCVGNKDHGARSFRRSFPETDCKWETAL